MLPEMDESIIEDIDTEDEDIELIEETEAPDYTYRINEDNTISGMVDDLDAIKQNADLILDTERFEYVIYSWDRGVELSDLIGKPIDFAVPELERVIAEALLRDDRISAVDGFTFDIDKSKIHAAFTVHTEYGSFDSDKEVEI